MEIIQIKEGVAFPMLIFPIGVVDKMEKSKLQIWFKNCLHASLYIKLCRILFEKFVNLFKTVYI